MLSLMIQVRVLAFGVLKDTLGPNEIPFDLPEGTTVADLLEHLREARQVVDELNTPGRGTRNLAYLLRGIAVSVNAEYANPSQILRDGDEVGLLPPVSGGTQEQTDQAQPIEVSLTRDPIDADNLVAAAKQGESGAVVVFDGIVRNNSRGRQTLYLDYEAYEEMATKQMNDLAHEAIAKYGVRHVTIIHRLGRLQVTETSVLIIVASAHRGQAFDACRWLIDTLKKKVPIWKKETFVDGAVWADGEPFPAGLGVEATNAL
jgi:molybdopterin synthase catalytic subunit/molybdopterin converting factor small subunit